MNSTSYYILTDSRSSFVRFMPDGSFTVGHDLSYTLWERTSVVFRNGRDFFNNDIYRALTYTADTEFDLTVTYAEGEDAAIVHIPLSRDCASQAHFEIIGLRAVAE
ncbi:hypothetical protein [Streptomyces sp. NPDC085932]|uniref:hypothetical protein n=1 Tax=Streptomyces sp. NPDC085932 TaxID=3365741 RepID=UPI0037D82158